MKQGRYPEEKIVSILREAEAGVKIEDICRKYGVSEGTFYRWKSKYSGMEVSDVKRMKSLEQENAQLKRIVANQALDIEALKVVLQKKF
jgi:putative transposase